MCATYTQTETQMDGCGCGSGSGGVGVGGPAAAAAKEEYESELEMKNQKIQELEELLAVSNRFTTDLMLDLNSVEQKVRKYAEETVISCSDCECKQQVSALADSLKKFIITEREANNSKPEATSGRNTTVDGETQTETYSKQRDCAGKNTKVDCKTQKRSLIPRLQNRNLPPHLQNKLQEDRDVEIIEIRHRRDKKILMDQTRELKDFMQSLKMKNNNLKKDLEERMEIQ
jgi:hypothetical protein